jgi:hypothetical protein
MNDLSWLIYFADLSGSTGVLAVATTIVSCIVIAFGVVYGGTIKDNWNGEFGDERWTRGHELQKFFLQKVVFIPIAAGLIAAVLPSRETVYAIAASELGEEIIKSPVATKAAKALESWLDEQINDKSK